MRSPKEVKKILEEEVDVGEMFHKALMVISEEIREVAILVKKDPAKASRLIEAIVDTLITGEDIYVKAVGRSGSIGDMWAMRAMTILGRKKVFIVGEKTTPKIIGGLLIVITGSGETGEAVGELERAKRGNSTTERLVITSTPGSPAWKLATVPINLGGKINDPMFPLRTSPELRALGYLEASNIVLKKLFDVSNKEMSGIHP